ncbi:MAG: histone deacetylase [Chloroflexi bacterium]|nr:histone deacetylase [Chloroflexota bacterium]
MSTIFVFTPALDHTKQGHPEGAHRLAKLRPFLDRSGILADLTQLEARLAGMDALRRVHSAALIDHVQSVSRRGGGVLDYGDTYATAASYDLARLAAGGCMTAVDAVMSGQARNGFALVRPPGHHAEKNQLSGFCLFNNVAVAARYAQAAYGIKRVLILDFDVHHGNGTQDIFYEDDSVLFMSMHLFIPRLFYPGTGSLAEIGMGTGEGYTLNVPLLPNVGDAGYQQLFTEVISPRVKTFAPELILISAGFDAHWQDPLAMAGLSLTGYAQLTRSLVELADGVNDGRILFVLEGGYLIEALHYGILNVFYALAGRDEIQDPLGAMPQSEQNIGDLLDSLKVHHLIS